MSHKLAVRIGQSEFTAEGEEATVNEQFSQFLNAIATLQPPVTPHLQSSSGSGEKGGGAQNGQPPRLIDRTLLESVFSQEHEGLISLRTIPATTNRDADALVLLLYGFRRMLEQTDVLALRLKAAAIHSGIPVSRLPSMLEVLVQYIRKGGEKRSSWYGLNNQGVLYAEGVLRTMQTQ